MTAQAQDTIESDARIGQRVGDYVVVARVADGAMGRVYEGKPVEGGSQSLPRVAIKVLHANVARDAVAVERFRREFEAAQEMDHPHIVRVVEFGDTTDGSQYMVMEFLEGEELGALLRRDGSMPIERIVRVLCQAAQALDYAHSFGFIHRDLKPDNVFLCRSTEGDQVRLLDFGSVKLQMETGPKLTAIGTTLGSPYYMSPEQATGQQDVDQRTDVFALGAILYEMLTGQIAFEAPNVAMILMRIMNEMPQPPSQQMAGVPAAVDDVIEKALRKDKTRRYDNAMELAQAFIAALGLSGAPDAWAKRPQADVSLELSRATPPAPKPFDRNSEGSSIRPAEPLQGAVDRSSGVEEEALRPVVRSNAGVLVGVLVGVAILVGAVIALLR